jgi:hypothetical protein
MKIRLKDKVHKGKWSHCEVCNPEGAAKNKRAEEKLKKREGKR